MGLKVEIMSFFHIITGSFQRWFERQNNTSTDKTMELSPEATEAIVRAVDVAGRMMKMQWELAIRYDHEGRFRDKGREAFINASFAFAYGFLDSCLQIQKVEFSLQASRPTAADSAIRIAGCFIWSWFPDVIDTNYLRTRSTI
jgi:hypothetical protein